MTTIQKTQKIATGTISAGKESLKVYFSDTPVWAKIVRFAGLILGSVGGAILLANPISLPVILVAAAPYMTILGNATALFVQGFTKK
jgi:hypothetical protein